jgi:hypothetical protein
VQRRRGGSVGGLGLLEASLLLGRLHLAGANQVRRISGAASISWCKAGACPVRFTITCYFSSWFIISPLDPIAATTTIGSLSQKVSITKCIPMASVSPIRPTHHQPVLGRIPESQVLLGRPPPSGSIYFSHLLLSVFISPLPKLLQLSLQQCSSYQRRYTHR